MKTSGLLRCLLLAAVLAPLSLLAAPKKFDIPAQPAGAALQLFGKQASADVTYPAPALKDVRSTEVQGEMEPAAALDQLLTGTGFMARQSAPARFVVTKIEVPKPGSIEGSVRDESGKPVAGAKVALADSDKAVATDKRGRFVLTEVPAGAHILQITAEGLQNTRVTDVTVNAGRDLSMSPITIPVRKQGTLELETYTVSAKKNDGVLELDPYAVEGRKEKPFAANMDIPRTINDAQPYHIFDSKTINQSGAVTIEDFLKQRLTMQTEVAANGQAGEENRLGNISTINLRGLGADKTLILINGRRLAGIGYHTLDLQPDLNGVPLSAIDRIEVLPTSASGIYGGSALGGVVNVILKKDYVGGEIRVTYDNTWNSDSPNRTLSANYGQALEGGRTHVRISGSISDAKPLLVQDRQAAFERNIARIQQNSPTHFSSVFAPWTGSLPNIGNAAITYLPVPTGGNGALGPFPAEPPFSTVYGVTNENPFLLPTIAPLELKDGTILSSNRTYVASGTSESSSTAALYSSLAANAGSWNFDLPRTTQFPTGLLRPYGAVPQSKALHAGIRRQMLPSLEAFADFSYTQNKSTSVLNPANYYVRVPAEALTNPFTTEVVVSFPDAARVPIITESVSRQLSLGCLLQLPSEWSAVADYTFSESRFSYNYYRMDYKSQSSDILSGVLNPFTDTLLHPLNLQKYYSPSFHEAINRLHSSTIRAFGPLPSLPWGRAMLTMGLDYRSAYSPARTARDDFSISEEDNEETRYLEREATTFGAYSEATVPLIKKAWLPGIHALDIQLSGRTDLYKVDSGTPYIRTLYNRTPPEESVGFPNIDGQPFSSKDDYKSHNYTVGVNYHPSAELTVRISQATAFLPPSPDQLLRNPNPDSFPSQIVDPRTGTFVEVQTISGGNPELKPQNSKSLNAGVIWEPQWKPIQGLRLNAEYYKIEQFNAIGVISAQDIVNQESIYSDRVVRNGNGAIVSVDQSNLNLFHRETEGWDLSATYGLSTAIGRFNLHAVKTRILHLKSQFALEQPEYDAAGFHPNDGGAPRDKFSATLSWQWKRWNAGWATRYLSSYKQSGAAGSPPSLQYGGGDVFQGELYIIPQGGDTIESQIYHDAHLGYTFASQDSAGGSRFSTLRAQLLDNLTIQCGVRNVFESIPPLDVFYRSMNYFSPFGDMRLRSYWISIRKNF